LLLELNLNKDFVYLVDIDILLYEMVNDNG